MNYIEVKTLAGMSHVRASDVVAVQFNDPQRCTIVMSGGVTLPCTEAAKEIVTRIESALAEAAIAPKGKS